MIVGTTKITQALDPAATRCKFELGLNPRQRVVAAHSNICGIEAAIGASVVKAGCAEGGSGNRQAGRTAS